MSHLTLESLPDELILHVISFLSSECALSALSRTNHRIHAISDRCLYRHNVLHSDGSALDWAAANGNMTTLHKSLEAGATLSAEQPKGPWIHKGEGPRISRFGRRCQARIQDFRPHPLSLAAAGGHEAMMRFILEHGVSPDVKDPEWFTPLAFAAIHGHASIARLLLAIGARQDIRSLTGHLPLQLAAFQGHQDLLCILLNDLESRQDGTFRDQTRGALITAVTAGRTAMVRAMIEHGAAVDFYYTPGKSLLRTAARSGQTEMVRLLLEKGANPDLVLDERLFYVALVDAVIENHDAVAHILLPVTNPRHRTRALSFAVRNANKHMAETLLANNTPPEFTQSEIPPPSRYNQGEGSWLQPLLLAVRCNNRELAELLLDHGADPNAVCSEWPDDEHAVDYDRVLFTAVEREYEAMVALLLERGADPDVGDAVGQSPLTYAIYTGNQAIIHCLLDRGANPHRAVNHQGRKLTSYWSIEASTRKLLQRAEAKWAQSSAGA